MFGIEQGVVPSEVRDYADLPLAGAEKACQAYTNRDSCRILMDAGAKRIRYFSDARSMTKRKRTSPLRTRS